jgi:hypothetical protein
VLSPLAGQPYIVEEPHQRMVGDVGFEIVRHIGEKVKQTLDMHLSHDKASAVLLMLQQASALKIHKAFHFLGVERARVEVHTRLTTG